MEEYEIEIINRAFNNCFGLKDAFIKFSDYENKIVKNQMIETLSYQTGLSKGFINRNRKEIKEL